MRISFLFTPRAISPSHGSHVPFIGDENGAVPRRSRPSQESLVHPIVNGQQRIIKSWLS